MENFIIYTRWLTWFQMLTPGGNNRTFIFLENLTLKQVRHNAGRHSCFSNLIDQFEIEWPIDRCLSLVAYSWLLLTEEFFLFHDRLYILLRFQEHIWRSIPKIPFFVRAGVQTSLSIAWRDTIYHPVPSIPVTSNTAFMMACLSKVQVDKLAFTQEDQNLKHERNMEHQNMKTYNVHGDRPVAYNELTTAVWCCSQTKRSGQY